MGHHTRVRSSVRHPGVLAGLSHPSSLHWDRAATTYGDDVSEGRGLSQADVEHDSFLHSFTRPPHRINVDVSFAPPAYVGETFPVSVSITNEDALTYDLWLDVLLSASDEHAGLFISCLTRLWKECLNSTLRLQEMQFASATSHQDPSSSVSRWAVSSRTPIFPLPSFSCLRRPPASASSTFLSLRAQRPQPRMPVLNRTSTRPSSQSRSHASIRSRQPSTQSGRRLERCWLVFWIQRATRRTARTSRAKLSFRPSLA